MSFAIHTSDRCPEPGALSQLAAGQSPAAERARIEQHLLRCVGCKHALATLLRELPRTVSVAGGSAGPHEEESSAIEVTGYDLLRPLGRGGMGVVYEAWQRSTATRVALKTVRSLAPGAAAALRREIHALRSLSHPGVIRILDEGIAHGLPYFAMELVQGESLAEVLAHSHSLPRALTCLRRVCSTLAVLHGRGVVHRDVNPRNILLREADQPVLVDFGLVTRFAAADSRDVLDFAGVTMGTLAYTAPEQLRGDLVDARADLYAIGCILYELMTGRVPFVATSQRALIEAHLYQEPQPPAAHPQLPAALGELSMRLLAKQPRDRIGYAHEVASALAAWGAHDWRQSASPAPQPYLYRSELVGRNSWLAEADKQIERCCVTGHGARIFVAGESGAGKTRLLAEVATLAARSGMSVVAAECAALSGGEVRARTTRDASLQALRPLLREIADRGRAQPDLAQRLLGTRGSLLATYEPALRELGEPAAPAPVTQEVAHLRLLTALRDTLAALCRHTPVLLIFDDLQWMDHLSFEFLSTLSPEFLERTRVLIIGAYRAEEGSAAIVGAAHTVHRRLGRLTAESLTAMASSMLALDSLPHGLAERVLAQAHGNPLFAAESLRMAISNRWLERRSGEGWAFSPPSTDGEIPLAPSTVEEMIARRVHNLSERARGLVELASVLGRSFGRVELLAASQLAQAHAQQALDELLSEQVIEEDIHGGLRFLHDKVPETVYARLSGLKRRGLHAAVVQALEASTQTEEAKAERYSELAFHWNEAGDPEQAALYWARAGERALQATAYADAIEHYEAALRSVLDSRRLCEDRRLLARWQRGLGEAYYGVGDAEQCELHLGRSLAGFGALGAPSDRPRAQSLLRRELFKQLTTGLHVVRGESARLTREELSEAALAAERLGFISLWKTDSLATMAYTLLAVNLMDELQLERPTTRPYSLLGFMCGVARLGPLERRYFRVARERAPRVPQSDYVYSLFMECFLRAGECAWQRADALKQEGLRRIDPQESLLARDATAIFGFMERARGHYDAARGHAHALRASAREGGNTEHEVWSEVLEGSCRLRALQYETARQHLERALSLLQGKPEWVCELRAYAQLAHVHYGMGHKSQAEALAAQTLELLRQHRGPPLMSPAIDAVMSLTHVYLELWREAADSGNDASKYEARAREALAHLVKLALVFPVARAYCLICAGRLSALRGRARTAAIAFELAQRTAAHLRLPYESAVCAWHRARHAATRAARDAWLARAHASFTDLGCALPPDARAPG